MSRLPFIYDLLDAQADEMQSMLTRSLLMQAHSVFEFALQQAVEHCLGENERPKRDSRNVIERYANALLTACNAKEALAEKEWQQVIVLSKARNIIAHTTGFQDRDFSFRELELLSSLEIRHAVLVTPPYYKAFHFHMSSVRRVCQLYCRLSRDLRASLAAMLSTD